MRLQVDRLELAGGNRKVTFDAGLNVITGPITTGKTTLLQLARLLVKSRIDVSDFPREVKDNVTGIAGVIEVGTTVYSLYRPLVSTLTANVEIASADVALLLPSANPTDISNLTFEQWLLRQLELPELRVPRAPTQSDSESTPLTINDFQLYCNLSENEIDSHVFGTSNHFVNIKRRYVFDVLYGAYDVNVAQLQEQLRRVLAEIRQLDAQTNAFQRFLMSTPWRNRAALAEQLDAARQRKAELEGQTLEIAANVDTVPRASELRSTIQDLDQSISEAGERISREHASINDLSRLVRQLHAQSDRLTRAIASGDLLIDFDFVVCPRCGTGLDHSRYQADVCSLCLQVPNSDQPDRDDLIEEQNRLSLQIKETIELITIHESTIEILRNRMSEDESHRNEVSQELDFELQSYLSDSASSLTSNAANRAAAIAEIERLEDYLALYEVLDQALGDAQTLQRQREQLEAQLDTATSRTATFEKRVQILERNFQKIIERFETPKFGDSLEATIDRRTYLPLLSDRSFQELSSQGLKVIVNVALILAHHITSLELNLGLPQIIFIDGLTSNLGHEGADLRRVHAMYDYLIELSESMADELQIFVADNDVPTQASAYVRLRLNEQDRLIRTA